jgi:enhancer of polycomb-like protein
MKAQQLAVDTLVRERRKAELVQAEREAWEGKLRLIEVKRKFPAMGIKPDEEDLLFRTGIGSSKKQKLDPVLDPAAKAAKGARKGRDSAAGSPAPGQDGKDRGGDAERHMPVEALRERTAAIAMQIEREVARKREGDYQWEDYTDVSLFCPFFFPRLCLPLQYVLTFSFPLSVQLAYQPLITPAPLRLFRPLVPELTPIPQPTTTTTPTTTTSPTSSTSSILSPEPLRSSSFRLRRGRGGIIRLDRRVDTRSSAGSKPRGIPAPSWRDERKREKGEPLLDCLFPDEWSSLPTGPKRDRVEDEEAVSTSMEGVLESNPVEEKSTENDEYGRRVSERWRYDSEAGVVGVGMGMHGLEDEERVIVDDFEERFVHLLFLNSLTRRLLPLIH